MIRIPNIVSAHPSTGIKSIAELIAYIKANPDKLNYASSGVGQSPHLTGAWFLQLTGLKMMHVPFRGAGPALQAALAGDIQILFDNLYPVAAADRRTASSTRSASPRPSAAPSAPEHPDHARERAGTGEIRRLLLVRRLPAEGHARPDRRCAQQGDQGDAGARGHQEDHRRDGRARRLGHAAAV